MTALETAAPVDTYVVFGEGLKRDGSPARFVGEFMPDFVESGDLFTTCDPPAADIFAMRPEWEPGTMVWTAHRKSSLPPLDFGGWVNGE